MPKAKNGQKQKPKAIVSPLTYSNLTEVVKTTNDSIERLKVYANELKIPSFGNSLYDCINDDGSNLPDIHNVIASTISDRITGKFERPDFTADQRLRRECNEAWITYERNHLSKIKWDDVGLNTRGVIYKARDLIHSWLNGSRDGQRFRFDRSFWHFAERAPIEFGPGESFISKQGDVSAFTKLDPFSMTVTIDCLEEAALFISVNKGFRSLFTEVFRKEDLSLKSKARSRGIKFVKNNELTINHKSFSKGVVYFASRVRSFLVQQGLVQRGSRGSSVYKNKEKRRFINVECFLNVILQKVAGWSLRQCLKFNADCDLDLGQDYHKRLISKPGWSTVDWQNASDSILTWLVKQLFARCRKVFNLLDRVRSQFVLINTTCAEKSRTVDVKQYHSPLKFSSMGNGFTFELLTIVNLAVVRTLDRSATVYGDDVILRSVYADDFIKHMTAVGFVPNLKKSFINLPFRESCGGFFEDRVGYIRSYDFKWNWNIADCIVTANKLGRILRGNPDWEHPLKDRMLITYEELIKTIPATFCGPVVNNDDIPTWLERCNYRHRQMKDDFCRKTWSKYSRVATQMAELHQHTELRELGYNPGDFTIVMIPTLKNRVKIKAIRNVKNIRLVYSYIHLGMVSPMLLRQQKSEYRFGFKPTLVHSEGWSLRVATACKIAERALQFERITKLAYAA